MPLGATTTRFEREREQFMKQNTQTPQTPKHHTASVVTVDLFLDLACLSAACTEARLLERLIFQSPIRR